METRPRVLVPRPHAARHAAQIGAVLIAAVLLWPSRGEARITVSQHSQMTTWVNQIPTNLVGLSRKARSDAQASISLQLAEALSGIPTYGPMVAPRVCITAGPINAPPFGRAVAGYEGDRWGTTSAGPARVGYGNILFWLEHFAVEQILTGDSYAAQIAILEEFLHACQHLRIRDYMNRRGFNDVTKGPANDPSNPPNAKSMTAVGAALAAKNAEKHFMEAEATKDALDNFCMTNPVPGPGASNAEKERWCERLERLCDEFEAYCRGFDDESDRSCDLHDMLVTPPAGSGWNPNCANSMTIKFCKRGGGTTTISWSPQAIKDMLKDYATEKATLATQFAAKKAMVKQKAPTKED